MSEPNPDCQIRGPHPRHALAGGKPTNDKVCPGGDDRTTPVTWVPAYEDASGAVHIGQSAPIGDELDPRLSAADLHRAIDDRVVLSRLVVLVDSQGRRSWVLDVKYEAGALILETTRDFEQWP